MKRDERALRALARVAWPVLRRHFRPDCCIAATRLGLAVLERYGIHGKATEVLAMAGNASFFRWSPIGGPPPEGDPPADARFVAVVPEHAPPGGYAGHLVITGRLRGQLFLLDLSAPQLHRPDKQILIPEALVGIPLPRPVTERALVCPLAEGGRLIYEAHPQAAGVYLAAPDWTLRGYRRALAAEVAAELHAAVESELLHDNPEHGKDANR